MLGASTIRDMQRNAAVRAAKERRVPFVYWPGDSVEPGRFPFPFLGDYTPAGWHLVDTLFCDSSGMGADDEAALSVQQLRAEIVKRTNEAAARRVTVGWAIVEAGQFQAYVGVFEKPYEPVVTEAEHRLMDGNR